MVGVTPAVERREGNALAELEGELIDIAESICAVIAVVEVAVLDEDVLALLVREESQGVALAIWIPEVELTVVIKAIKIRDEVITGLIALFALKGRGAVFSGDVAVEVNPSGLA